MALSLSLYEIISIGVDMDFLDIDDAISIAVTNIRCFVYIGALRNHLWFCPRHETCHELHICSAAENSFDALIVFQSSMNLPLGLSDYYEKYILRNPHAEYAKHAWDAFIDFRLWELLNLRT